MISALMACLTGVVVNLLDRAFVSDEVIMLMVVRQKGFDQVD